MITTMEEARQALRELYDAETGSQWNARGANWKPLVLLRPDLYKRAKEAREFIKTHGGR